MKDYDKIEDKELYLEGQEYLKTVTKQEFIKNNDAFFYARQVKNGTIPACKYVKWAVEREFKKLSDPDCPYYFDPEPGFKFFAFCRYLYLFSGLDGGGNNFILSWWQIWIFSQLLGWKHKSGQYQGKRVYKNCYLECPRGSGKTTMMAAFGMYMLTLDGEGDPEIYVAATKKDQANIMFNSVKKQIFFPANSELIEELQVDMNREIIRCNGEKGGFFKSLSRDSKSFDGFNVHCAMIDEIHAHKDSFTWDTIKSGTSKRAQSMMIGISTAGISLTGYGYRASSVAKTLLKGSHENDPDIQDDQTFACIWTIDEGDDYQNDPLVVQKATPGWFSSVNQMDILNNINRIKIDPAAKSEILPKYLCVWYNSCDKWLKAEHVLKCNDLTIPESDFSEENCIIGVDVAFAEDMLAYTRVYMKYNEEDGKNHYYIYPEYFTPEANVNNIKNAKYLGWVNDGILNSCDGEIIDLDEIKDLLIAEYHKRNVIEYCFDPWNATQMAVSLQNEFGTGSVYFASQSYSGLNEASKFFKTLIIENRIHFSNDIFVWNCLNCFVRYNTSGTLIQITKEAPNSKDKIDGVAACINALCRWLALGSEGDGPSVVLM